MNNIYEEAIEFFLQQGKKIKDVSDLIVRGTSRDTKTCTPHWSDIDVSIIVEEINIEIYDQVRQLYKQMREKFSFKISITLVTKSDFLSSRHHHGTKPIYYNFSLQSSLRSQDEAIQFTNPDIHELKYDCFYNIVFLMHSLRIEDMQRGSDLKAMQEFCCQLLKSSNHLIRNSIFIKTGHIQKKIDINMFNTCFPNIDQNVLQKIKDFKKNWPHILENYNDLMHIREYMLPIVSSIYDQMVVYFSNLNYKVIMLSNAQDLDISSNIKTDEGLPSSRKVVSKNML